MKNKLALVVAVLLGLVAMYGFYRYSTEQRKQYEEEFRSIKIVAASQRIRAGTEIRPGMLTLIEIPSSAVSADHIVAGDQTRLLGQTIVRAVEGGEPLLNSYFRRPAEKLTDRISHGERALTLRVDAVSGVAGNLVPGSRVDVIGTFPAGAWTPGARPASGAARTAADQSVALLSNVTVLAVDRRTRAEEYALIGETRGRSYDTVTLAVTPEESVLLVFAQQYGSLTLTLRPEADTTLNGLQTNVNEQNLLDIAERVQEEREKRLKKRPPMEVLPAQP